MMGLEPTTLGVSGESNGNLLGLKAISPTIMDDLFNIQVISLDLYELVITNTIIDCHEKRFL
jgi:hypothetical protein